ncbi:hypothetical protein IAU59_000659 [Kwoniella sp. CBS 9459]
MMLRDILRQDLGTAPTQIGRVTSAAMITIPASHNSTPCATVYTCPHPEHTGATAPIDFGQGWGRATYLMEPRQRDVPLSLGNEASAVSVGNRSGKVRVQVCPEHTASCLRYSRLSCTNPKAVSDAFGRQYNDQSLSNYCKWTLALGPGSKAGNTVKSITTGFIDPSTTEFVPELPPGDTRGTFTVNKKWTGQQSGRKLKQWEDSVAEARNDSEIMARKETIMNQKLSGFERDGITEISCMIDSSAGSSLGGTLTSEEAESSQGAHSTR